MKNTNVRTGIAAAAVVALLSGAGTGESASPFAWDSRAVEHLYNRAGFGARPAEIEAGVAMGQAALVEKLLSGRVEVEPFFWEKIDPPRGMRELPEPERREIQREVREKDRRQLLQYTAWWLDRMSSGEDPLRERMVLFWHGFFTSSIEEVKRGWLLIRQNQLLREHALGSYADLLAEMLRDPAMLTYLDNQVNRKGEPNENLARELMELFSLGIGNFTESDVQEAARALTGRGVSKDGDYEFHPRQHDAGRKTVLGVEGKLDGDDLVAILLKQEACPKWIASKLLAYFEGQPPSAERRADYARFMRQNEYRIEPFLRRLFLDPAFYRDEVVGTRIQGPVDFMVGLSRRLGTRVPANLIGGGSAVLGQRLFSPPSVKGWDGGESWITTATLMQRGNLAGIVLGVVKVDDVLSEADLEMTATVEPSGSSEGAMQDSDRARAPERTPDRGADREAQPPDSKAGPKAGAKTGGKAGGPGLQALRRAEASGWAPSIHFSARMNKAGARTDAEITDRMLEDLLAIRAPADTRAKLREFVARERTELAVADGKLLEAGAGSERLLRRLAHVILSLPEAQLD